MKGKWPKWSDRASLFRLQVALKLRLRNSILSTRMLWKIKTEWFWIKSICYCELKKYSKASIGWRKRGKLLRMQQELSPATPRPTWPSLLLPSPPRGVLPSSQLPYLRSGLASNHLSALRFVRARWNACKLANPSFHPRSRDHCRSRPLVPVCCVFTFCSLITLSPLLATLSPWLSQLFFDISLWFTYYQPIKLFVIIHLSVFHFPVANTFVTVRICWVLDMFRCSLSTRAHERLPLNSVCLHWVTK